MLKNKLTKDPKWIDNVLRETYKKVFTHLIRMGMNSFLKDAGTYHILGADFLIDENLKIWLIEVNSGPGMKVPNEVTRELKGTMVKETFDLVFHMLEIKTKKLLKFLNENAEKYKK